MGSFSAMCSLESSILPVHQYRADIDGLRALAVLAVVVFHAFPSLIPGGFTGVDIFFVISGFLISGIIFKETAAGTFHLADFYARRVKRIFPALGLVLLAVTSFGYFVLLAQEFKQLGAHVAGGAGFIANLLLWRESGYFDNSGETKPLLHLWSLGVEEQFYIVWPVVVFFAWKYRAHFVKLTIALAVGSFLYNIANVDQNAVAAFYSPVSRFWELALGGLLAYQNFTNSEKHVEFVKLLDDGVAPALPPAAHEPAFKSENFWAGLGVLLIAAGFAFTAKSSAFPGYWALLPTLGAVFVLGAGPTSAVSRRLLANPVMVWVGTISYPLYLWHWPLLSYARILESGRPSTVVIVAAVALSVLLAWLTYRLVEAPIRFGKKNRSKVVGLVVILFVQGCIGYFVYASNGLPARDVINLGRYLPKAAPAPAERAAVAEKTVVGPEDTAPTVAYISDDSPATEAARSAMRKLRQADVQFLSKLFDQKNSLERYQRCHIYDSPEVAMTFESYRAGNSQCAVPSAVKQNVLVFGDSAAAEMHLALSRAYPEVNFLQITGSACKPFHAAYSDSSHRCVKLLDYALHVNAGAKLDAVVVAASWADDYARALPELTQFAATGAQVLLVGPPLRFAGEVSATLLRMDKSESLAVTMRGLIDQDNIKHSDEMRTFAKANGIAYLNRLQVYCAGGCPIINERGEPLILDTFHLSLPGVDLLAARIKATGILDKLLASNARPAKP